MPKIGQRVRDHQEHRPVWRISVEAAEARPLREEFRVRRRLSFEHAFAVHEAKRRPAAAVLFQAVAQCKGAIGVRAGNSWHDGAYWWLQEQQQCYPGDVLPRRTRTHRCEHGC